jgi:acetyl-CoA carboxylase carboxyltransferase component
MSTQKKLIDLQERRKSIMEGEIESVKQQKDAGKLTARERLAYLFDEGTFVEIGAFVKQRPTELDEATYQAAAEAVVTGYGAVDGKLVYAYAQDATVLGGALGEMHAKKIEKIIDMAIKMGAPVVSVFDSNGARLKEGVDAMWGYSSVIAKTVEASGVVPQISVVAGLCSGGSALICANSDFTIMTKNAQMFLTAPVILKAALGQDTAEVGTAQGALKAGNVHFIAEDDSEAIAAAKQVLSYLPSNNLDGSSIFESDDANRVSEMLNTILDEAYSMESIINEVTDLGSFLPCQNGYGEGVITGLARLNGEPVGIIANNGDICALCASKAARFIQVCDSFNIPVITFTDVTGFAMSAQEETGGNIRAIARLSSAYAAATCPKVNVIVKNAIASGAVVMTVSSDVILAWPTAQIGPLPADTATEILYNDEIAKAEGDPSEKRAELAQKYRDVICAPYEAAKRGYIDDIISPDTTRQYLIAALSMLSSKRVSGPAKKHTDMPF